MSNKAIIRGMLDLIDNERDQDHYINGLLVGLRQPFADIVDENRVVFCLTEDDVRDLLKELLSEVKYFKSDIWPLLPSS
jgi:hypothetical protein